MRKSRVGEILLTVLLVACPTFAETVVVTGFTTVIKPNHYYLEHGLRNEPNCTMTYDDLLVDTLGAAFELDYTDPGGTGMDAYPSGIVGGDKKAGVWYPGDPALTGMPVAMPSLGHDFRIQWKVSVENAYDSDDYWWATINVIFDGGTASSEPVAADRDYDVVIQLINNKDEDFSDLPKEAGQSRYWWFARNLNGTIKPFVLNIDGTDYEWALRYKFHSSGDKANKVHLKFIPLDSQNIAPYIDHSLKVFTDAAEDYLQYIDFTGYPAEEALAHEKINNPNLFVKSVAAGFEVYSGSMVLRNDHLRTVVDHTAPDAPTGLIVTANGLNVDLVWNDSAETSLEAYAIWRKKAGDASFSKVTSTLRGSSYTDTTVEAGESYSYYVTAIDRSFNESSASAEVSVDVQLAPNSPPVSLDDFASANQNTAHSVMAPGVLSNDTDADGDPLLAVLVSDVNHGTLFLYSDGSYDYTPNTGFSGSDSFTYLANDGTDNSPVATVTIAVSEVSPPTQGEIDIDDPLVPAGLQPGDTFHFVFVNSPANSIDSTWDLPQLNGHLNDIANNGGGYSGSLVARFGLTWYAIASDTTTDARDNALVSAPVYRIDGALVATGFDDMWDGSIANNIEITEQNTVQSGVVRTGSNSDGTAGDHPFGLGGGKIDRGFSSASDATWMKGGSEGGGVRRNAYALSEMITITGEPTGNRQPESVDDTANVDQDTVLNVASPGVLINDTDADNDPLTAVLNTDVSHGTLALNSDGSFDYTPNVGFFGADSFTYLVYDGIKYSEIATVSLTINEVVAPTPRMIHFEDPMVPTGLQPGDTFHFVFINSPANSIDSSWNLTQLNSHLNDVANDGGGYSGSLVSRLGLTWYAIASDTTTDARDNALVSAPVYRIDGALVATGFNDMWDGSIATNINITEQNTVQSGIARTGSKSDGTAGKNPFGVAGGKIDRGFSSAVDATWIQGSSEGDSIRRNAYALSEIITVTDDNSVSYKPTDVDGQSISTVGGSGGAGGGCLLK